MLNVTSFIDFDITVPVTGIEPNSRQSAQPLIYFISIYSQIIQRYHNVFLSPDRLAQRENVYFVKMFQEGPKFDPADGVACLICHCQSKNPASNLYQIFDYNPIQLQINLAKKFKSIQSPKFTGRKPTLETDKSNGHD